MSIAPEEFDKLQKLLKLKRYEIPPPGYFNNFSTRVVNRLEREAESDNLMWLKKLFAVLETNPIAAGLFGMSVCGLLITGIAYSQAPSPSDYAGTSGVMIDMASNSSTQTQEVTRTASVDSLAPSPVLGTNGTSVFDSVMMPATERASFQVNQ